MTIKNKKPKNNKVIGLNITIEKTLNPVFTTLC
jgi:hypothetical protein